MIETKRLKLIACNQAHIHALMNSEPALAQFMGLWCAPGLVQFPESLPFALKMLDENPQNIRWGTFLFIYKVENKIIGLGGFKGVQNEEGMVEFGYSVVPTYRKKGFGTEAARGMIDYAFEWAIVNFVDAHTLPELNASTKILEKCGLTKIGEKVDETDGHIWHWRLERAEYEKKNSG
jgi:RimJ/RimL family protein N-acetyltransferase